jgi:hypothetical protein
MLFALIAFIVSVKSSTRCYAFDVIEVHEEHRRICTAENTVYTPDPFADRGRPPNRDCSVRLSNTRVRPIFVTLNYGLFLELAIQATGSQVYEGLTEPPRDNVYVLKIHGSCNLLPDTGRRTFKGENNIFKSLAAAIFEGAVRPARSTDEIHAFLEKQTMLAPVMAMYAKGKRVLYCPKFVEELKAS